MTTPSHQLVLEPYWVPSPFLECEDRALAKFFIVSKSSQVRFIFFLLPRLQVSEEGIRTVVERCGKQRMADDKRFRETDVAVDEKWDP